jgi:hypothetical protein
MTRFAVCRVPKVARDLVVEMTSILPAEVGEGTHMAQAEEGRTLTGLEGIVTAPVETLMDLAATLVRQAMGKKMSEVAITVNLALEIRSGAAWRPLPEKLLRTPSWNRGARHAGYVKFP